MPIMSRVEATQKTLLSADSSADVFGPTAEYSASYDGGLGLPAGYGVLRGSRVPPLPSRRSGPLSCRASEIGMPSRSGRLP
jgi:hypothetical protein